MKTSFISREEIESIGFGSVGENVLISRFAQFYDVKNIKIGNHVRIDDFCMLSGKIELGSYIHISAYSALYGKYGIEIQDYSGISPRGTIFSATDDFSGKYLIGPMHPPESIRVIGGKVILERFVQIGAGSIVLPEVIIKEGTVVGAMSLVDKSLPEWSICYGTPAKIIKPRSKDLLKYVK